jgi:hypothetical protein
MAENVSNLKNKGSHFLRIRGALLVTYKRERESDWLDP